MTRASAQRRRAMAGGHRTVLALLLLACALSSLVHAAALERGPVPGIVGTRFEYVVRKGDTLTAISARYAVSEKALIRDNALRPPYLLKPGDRVHVHNRHLVPDGAPPDGIVINLPQRLLFVFRNGQVAAVYPVAAGKPDWQTPTGSYSARTLQQDKAWIVPPSIQDEMRAQGKPVLTRVEPGPENPLGRYWIGLSLSGYGIHGTNAPGSIYYLRTHGCIRVHPEDIEALYGQMSLHMPVKIIYAHTLLARLADGRILVEVNRDFYDRGGDPLQIIRDMARQNGLDADIDWAAAQDVANARIGQAFEIGRAGTQAAAPRGAAGVQTKMPAWGTAAQAATASPYR
ncbi:MAG: L,D-transpeptidase family protein [Rhodospirillaceae bacterium]